MYPLTCIVQPYDWGSLTFIPSLLGQVATGERQAEMWMGAHPMGPSSTQFEGEWVPLGEIIAADPIRMLGADSIAQFGLELPFLMKVLAAERPLSLQAHPTKDRAIARLAEEDLAGVPLTSPTRLYKDGNHKPELICALTTFEALCGFRPLDDAVALFESLADHDARSIADRLKDESSSSALEEVVEDLLRRRVPVTGILMACRRALTENPGSRYDRAFYWAVELGDTFANDPGSVISLLMNYVILEPGEALTLPAGNLHAYLQGSGIELMANSDNVLRGGLTSKHVDVDELLQVVDFSPLMHPLIAPTIDGPVSTFASPSDEFQLQLLTLGGTEVSLDVHGPEILICTAGSASVTSLGGGDEDAHNVFPLGKGQVVFVPAASRSITVKGEAAQVYRATIGARPGDETL
jgi:mannose-6-phosphate isomerase